EMAGRPDRAVGGLDQQVDVVVAAADRAELRLRPGAQRPAVLAARDLFGQLGDLAPDRRVEQRVVDRRLVLAAEAEADAGADRGRQPAQVGGAGGPAEGR